MRALTFRGIRDVAIAEVPDPQLLEPHEALLEVELAAICGSDLHPYLGRETGLDVGTVFGHEFVGRVIAVGSGCREVAEGQRYVAPFTTSCGACFYCGIGLTARCIAGELFGWVEQGRGLHGGQAQIVRVPLADTTLVLVPEHVPSEEALLAGDVLSTGFFAAHSANIQHGDTALVVGVGPVGICAVIGARELGAERVFAIDPQPERLQLAASFGAIPLDTSSDRPHAALLDHTHGRGADAVLECVGNAAATRTAIDLARPGATIAAAGVHCEPQLAFRPGEAYDKNLTYRAGRCSARAMMATTMPLVAEQRLELGRLYSHRLALAEAALGYELFAERRDGCTKVLLDAKQV